MAKVTLFRIQKALDFIEEHLQQDFPLSEVAEASGLSLYHLHRTFSAAYGESLKAYIRKRRLTLAAERLRLSSDRIIEIAIESSFSSQEAFTRAFQAYYGLTPGKYRKDPNKSIVPGLFKPSEDTLEHRFRGVSQQPRFEWVEESFEVFGEGVAIDFFDEQPVVELWRSFFARHPQHQGPFYGVTQLSHPQIEQDEEHSLTYLASTRLAAEIAAKEKARATIFQGYYAVFEHHGSLERIIDTVNYVWASWLPGCKYQKSDRPDFETFGQQGLFDPQPSLEIWVSLDPAP